MNSDGLAGASGQTHGFNHTAVVSKSCPSFSALVKDFPAPQSSSDNANVWSEGCSAAGILNIRTLMSVVLGTVLVAHRTRNEFKVNDLVLPLPLNFTPRKYTKNALVPRSITQLPQFLLLSLSRSKSQTPESMSWCSQICPNESRKGERCVTLQALKLHSVCCPAHQ